MQRHHIIKTRKVSPGIIGGEVVHFIESGTKDMFWFKHDGTDSFHKDEKGKYSTLSFDQVVDARMIYLASYENDEKEALIQKSIESQKKELAKKGMEIVDKIEAKEKAAVDGFQDTLAGMIIKGASQERYENHVQAARQFFIDNPNIIELKNTLKSALLNDDFDLVYHIVEFQFGKPTVSFKTTGDLTAMINTIGSENIVETIENTRKHGSLYLIAKAEVEKQYYPE